MERSLVTELRSKLNMYDLPKPVMVGMVGVVFIGVFLAVWMIISVMTKPKIVIDSADSAGALTGSETALASEMNDAQANSESTIFVHVSGAVEDPGLYELDANSRVAQAIEKAGGFKEEADTTSVNLARILSDGEQLYVLMLGQDGMGIEGGAANTHTMDAAGTKETGMSNIGSGSKSTATGKVNINAASVSELVSLPGIGEATARKIVNDRTANGPFKNIEELTRVSGIGDKKLESLRELICV